MYMNVLCRCRDCKIWQSRDARFAIQLGYIEEIGVKMNRSEVYSNVFLDVGWNAYNGIEFGWILRDRICEQRVVGSEDDYGDGVF